MNFGRHIPDAANSAKSNGRRPARHLRRRAHIRRMYSDAVYHHKCRPGRRELSPETVRKIKDDIRESMKAERQRAVVIYLIIGLAASLGGTSIVLIIIF